jgi:SAM-dependent methyltransferase
VDGLADASFRWGLIEPTGAYHMTNVNVKEIAQLEALPWKEHIYYTQAETWLEDTWKKNQEFLADQTIDYSVVIDLACGHGRNTEKLRQVSGRVICMDIQPENVAFCVQRFAGDARVQPMLTSGTGFDGIGDGTISFVYCYDAMVHFDMHVIHSYVKDTARILVPGGFAFYHHSNLTAHPGRDHRFNPHWRSLMSRDLFAHLAIKEGLEVAKQQVIDWGSTTDLVREIDCMSLVRRP